ncbi:unnamed protein product [Gongylonema pulchrum]|uniref:Myb_DNA-bind_3 domain-containing protein n=1 Tax=Gongylonema pulchrum TaxID=637853 RepID=A0A183DG21_9BILA|nr:unnamed protein product [Gongylonema pulchrum]
MEAGQPQSKAEVVREKYSTNKERPNGAIDVENISATDDDDDDVDTQSDITTASISDANAQRKYRSQQNASKADLGHAADSDDGNVDYDYESGEGDVAHVHNKLKEPIGQIGDHEQAIFEEMTHLKKMQLQYGKVKEHVLVRSLINNFCKMHGLNPANFKFQTFHSWEKFLNVIIKL